ncbi:MAG: amidohydrolase family protein [Lachnospiraceae bacterium]|nr:amidohydrolase family protein [Lachnospiraceae bacterium]
MERKVIDFHTHAFPDKIAGKTIELLSQKAGIPAHTDGTAEGLKKALTDAGISLGIVLPVVTRPEQFESVTRFATAINEDRMRKKDENNSEAEVVSELLSFGGIHPDTKDYKKELKLLSEAGFLGVKLHPDYQGVFFDDIRYMRIIEYASELGLIVITHAGVDIGFPDMVRCTPKRALKVLREVKPEKLVLAHCGGWRLWEEVMEVLAGEQVYMDTAYSMGHISEEMFLSLCRRHGVDKMLFATDCPWGNPKQDVDTFLSMPLTKEEQELILYKNAERLLKK